MEPPPSDRHQGQKKRKLRQGQEEPVAIEAKNRLIDPARERNNPTAKSRNHQNSARIARPENCT